MTCRLALALVLWSGVAAADETAEALYDKGQAAFDAKQFDAAIVAWEQSFELSKESVLLFNVAQAYRLRGAPGDCTKALTNYQKFIELNAESDQRPVAERFAAELKPCAARETTPIAEPIIMQPPPVATSVRTPTVEPRDEDRPGRGKKIAGLAVAGGGVGLIATGFYFGYKASALGDEVTRACYDGCDWATYSSKDDAGRRDQTLQFVFKGAGVAAVIGGGVLYWLGHSDATSNVAVAPRSDGAVLTWSGSW